MIEDEVTKRLLGAYEAGDLVTVCGWCERAVIDGEWVLLPRAARAAIDAGAVSHSICPECAAAQQRAGRSPGPV